MDVGWSKIWLCASVNAIIIDCNKFLLIEYSTHKKLIANLNWKPSLPRGADPISNHIKTTATHEKIARLPFIETITIITN